MQVDEEYVPPPRPQITECLLPQGVYGQASFIKPNDRELIDLASSFDIRYASSAIELKNFAEICLSTRRAFGPQTSVGIEALELKVLQCDMMIKKKFPNFNITTRAETKADLPMQIATPTAMHVDEPPMQDIADEEELQMQEEEEEEAVAIDFQAVKNAWLDRVEAAAKIR
jgi:hypothetical protein